MLISMKKDHISIMLLLPPRGQSPTHPLGNYELIPYPYLIIELYLVTGKPGALEQRRSTGTRYIFKNLTFVNGRLPRGNTELIILSSSESESDGIDQITFACTRLSQILFLCRALVN